MVSNAFSRPYPKPNPPAYCAFRKIPLPVVPPFFPPPVLQGYARWTDLDPLNPTDIAIYVPMPSTDVTNCWQGEATVGAKRLIITLVGTVEPNAWTLSLNIWHTIHDWEGMAFPNFAMQLEPSWDTGLQSHVYLPGLDFREARVRQ